MWKVSPWHSPVNAQLQFIATDLGMTLHGESRVGWIQP